MPFTVLITRPLEQSEKLAHKLRLLDIDSEIAPMLRVSYRPSQAIKHNSYSAILVTSANAVRALERCEIARDIPLFAVGRATARAARECQFTKVEIAEGTSESLARLVRQRISSKAGTLLRARGVIERYDLAGTLRADGYLLEEHILYEAAAATCLPRSTNSLLQRGDIDAACFFSPRSAKIFGRLATKAGYSLKSTAAIAISEQTAEMLPKTMFAYISVAKKPDEESMINCLKSIRR